ncbi:trypsin-like peptidase domain-containing protein [Candidatus Wolfebacteria bacterium]|nr:trypsin-like peptidase domain-containing protein [Candidatus Wolfebacteria bacterium]
MPKINKIIVTLSIILVTLLLPKNVLAIDGGYNTANIAWGVGRINSFSISKIAEPFWGATTGVVKINDVPADIASWGESFVNINVPSTVDGLGNIKVISSDGTEFNAGQLLISLRVDSYPQEEITLGDNIEITGNFGNTPGSENINSDSWPGRVANMSIDGFGSRLNLISWTDTKIVISTLGPVKVGINTLKIFYGSDNINNGYQSRTFNIQIKEPKCTADIWRCDGWNQCLSNGTRTMFCTKTFDCQFADTPSPEPGTLQTCIPPCVGSDWSCNNWSICSSNGSQTRTCNKTSNCQGGISAPALSQSCTYVPTCTSYSWSCSSWGVCSSNGIKTRECNKISNCEGGTPSPVISQNCTPTQESIPAKPQYQQPSCSEDVWSCDNWGACSPNGIQTRSCKRTYDCLSAETPAPATSQYCQAPNQPQTPSYSNNMPSIGGSSAQSNNTINESTNQDSIIQATVKLICLVNKTSGMQGSGTVIDPKGIILTNRHVVEGTKGCMVGFINSSDDDPSFTEVADIVKLSTDEDIALIKIRNDGSKSFVYSDISNGSINSKNLGNKIMIFGYPSIGGAKLNYSDGAVSGFGSAKDGMGNYIKTNAAIDHGNSGGGAYLASNSRFIGIPSAGMKGDLSSVGYILSINKIKSWMNGSGLAYNGNGFSNLSSKSIKASSLLKNVDISDINILDVSSANVSIYSNKTKTTLLPNNPDTIQIYNRPAFEINNVDEESGVVGYYVYFGTNMKADPVKKGKLIKKPEYIPLTITQKGAYYFIFRAKNKNGNTSESVITEYRYKK